MKLYVWDEFCPNYVDGLAFAIAESEEAARASINEALGYCPPDGTNDSNNRWGRVRIYELNEPVAFAVTGGEG
jgi:hypothetical protein